MCPNWCECKLTVSGSPRELRRFQKFAKSKEEKDTLLDENAFIPYPKRFRDIDKVALKYLEKHKNDKDCWQNHPKNGFNSGGYEWCIENWGTKWGICNEKLVRDVRYPTDEMDTIEYEFESAWSPPNPLIIAMSRKFPKLSFFLEYWEGGMCFAGSLEVVGGSVELDESHAYRGTRGG